MPVVMKMDFVMWNVIFNNLRRMIGLKRANVFMKRQPHLINLLKFLEIELVESIKRNL